MADASRSTWAVIAMLMPSLSRVGLLINSPVKPALLLPMRLERRNREHNTYTQLRRIDQFVAHACLPSESMLRDGVVIGYVVPGPAESAFGVNANGRMRCQNEPDSTCTSDATREAPRLV
ncbi:hypothetical protein CHU98_g3969 [Xylaria longipes]|nr:hypothetical protein CHU98_g3969 [Xylaria longipes]